MGGMVLVVVVVVEGMALGRVVGVVVVVVISLICMYFVWNSLLVCFLVGILAKPPFQTEFERENESKKRGKMHQEAVDFT